MENFQLDSGRHKRDIGKHLEVMVVTDSTVIDFHGEDDAELFLLAIFNMVSRY